MPEKHEVRRHRALGVKGLRAFKAVMDAGTVTAAAAKLNVAQSALTRLIINLEQDVGLELFQRQRKRLIPTAAGEAFLIEVQRILDRIDEIPTIVNQIRAKAVKRLRIVVTPRLGASIVAPAAAAFAASHPDIGLSIEMLSRSELERWVLRETFDIGFTALPIAHQSLYTVPLFETPAVIAMPVSHPLAGRTMLSARDVADERWVSVFSGSRLRAESDEILSRAGVTPRVQIEASSTTLATHLVAASAGIMMTDLLSAQAIGAGRISVARWKPNFQLRFAVMFPSSKSATPMHLEFVNIVRGVIQEAIRTAPFKGTALLPPKPL
jgi:DNA-binding transcriptional LysR family regulator